MSGLNVAHVYSGKVRDLYEVGDDHLLLVATDRLSAFDVVMAEPIPHKGRVLTALTNYWSEQFADVMPSALVSCDPAVIDTYVPGFGDEVAWHGRTMLARRAEMLPLECIVRARLAGQAYESYVRDGTVHGLEVPAGLLLTDAFEEPIFTPSTKENEGHDRYVDLDEARALVGGATLETARALCLRLFRQAAAQLAAVGLVLADTKFELGFVNGELVVCDEVLTPDSSRIWPADAVRSGETPPSFDKQPFRDWLNDVGWDHSPPPPAVPEEIVAITSLRYVEAYERTTGRALRDWYGFSQ